MVEEWLHLRHLAGHHDARTRKRADLRRRGVTHEHEPRVGAFAPDKRHHLVRNEQGGIYIRGMRKTADKQDIVECGKVLRVARANFLSLVIVGW